MGFHMPYKTAITIGLLCFTVLFGWTVATTRAANAQEKPSEDDGWEVIFDGSNTDALRGWKTDKFPAKGYRIEEDGSLHAIDGSQDFITRRQYRDFDLRWEWKLSKGGNSGLLYRVTERGSHPHDTGPEYQIIDDPRIHLHSTASLYDMITPNKKAKIKPTGQWNTSRIVIKDNNVQHYLNDELVVEYTWGSDDIKKRLRKSKFRNWKGYMQAEKGYIGFQSHGKDLWFRNIKIKDLSKKK